MSRPDASCPMNEQAVAWALRALEPDEEMVVLRHLPTCASCRAAVQEAEHVLARLGAAVEQVEPPPSLRASLMARVAETPQSSRLVDDPDAQTLRVGIPAVPSQGPVRRDRPPVAPPSGPRDSRPPRGSWLSRRGRRLVAASVALVGVLVVGGLVIRTGQLQQERDAQIAQAQSMSQLLDQLSQPGSALLSQDGRTVAAVVVVDGRRQVYNIDLPANATDRDIYVLWGLRPDGDPSPLGTFDVAAATAGAGAAAVGTVPGADQFAQYAISIEPGRVAPPTPGIVVAVGATAA